MFVSLLVTVSSLLSIVFCYTKFVIKQVEFNKAAQSLSEALAPATKKAALTRLLKVCDCKVLLELLKWCILV